MYSGDDIVVFCHWLAKTAQVSDKKTTQGITDEPISVILFQSDMNMCHEAIFWYHVPMM